MKNITKIIGIAAFAALIIGTILIGCASMQLVSLETDSVVGPRQVRQYQDINPRDITVYGIYKDDSRKAVNISSENIVFDKHTPGPQTVKIRVSSLEASFQTEVMALTGITVASQPNTVTFRQGQEASAPWSGLAIQGEWDQMGSGIIASGSYRISGFDINRAGRQTITVSFEGLTATFNVEVRGLANIQIAQPPAKLEYTQGESLNLTGLRVVGEWENLPPPQEIAITTADVTGFNANNIGRQRLTITKNGRTAGFDVEVRQPGTPPVVTPPVTPPPQQAGTSGPSASRPITWTEARVVNSVDRGVRVSTIAYGGGRFVAGIGNSYGGQNMAYSDDGVNWTVSAATPFDSQNVPNLIAYGGGKFVAVSQPSGAIVYSTDGINWTKTTTAISDLGGSTAIMAYGNGKFVAICTALYSTRATVAYSSDGINWTTTTSEHYFSTIVWNGNIFVGAGGVNYNIVYSRDGINWTRVTNHPFPESRDYGVRYVFWSGDRFIAITSDNNYWAYSADGINWTALADRPGFVNNSGKFVFPFSLVHAGGIFKGTGFPNSDGSAVSNDCVNWFLQPDRYAFTDMVYGNKKLVGITGGAVIYSNDLE